MPARHQQGSDEEERMANADDVLRTISDMDSSQERSQVLQLYGQWKTVWICFGCELENGTGDENGSESDVDSDSQPAPFLELFQFQ
jgi:hypothetical protein